MTTLDPTRNSRLECSLAWSPFRMEQRATAAVTEQVEANSALKAILDCVALPVWVLDRDGLVLLANPAALDALGFDALAELQGRHGHDAVHYMHPDGSPFPAEDCPVLRAEPHRRSRAPRRGLVHPA